MKPKFNLGEEVAWGFATLLLGAMIFVFSFIGFLIAFKIFDWLYLNGLSGIWENIKNVGVAIWRGAS